MRALLVARPSTDLHNVGLDDDRIITNPYDYVVHPTAPVLRRLDEQCELPALVAPAPVFLDFPTLIPRLWPTLNGNSVPSMNLRWTNLGARSRAAQMENQSLRLKCLEMASLAAALVWPLWRMECPTTLRRFPCGFCWRTCLFAAIARRRGRAPLAWSWPNQVLNLRAHFQSPSELAKDTQQLTWLDAQLPEGR